VKYVVHCQLGGTLRLLLVLTWYLVSWASIAQSQNAPAQEPMASVGSPHRENIQGWLAAHQAIV